MSILQDDLIAVAYKKLKQMVYYEKTHLFVRQRLADFECDAEFENRLRLVERVVRTESPTQTEEFQKWLKQIRYAVLPKGVKGPEAHDKDNGTFVTNVTSQKRYSVEKVNYIFDGPIELHLIAVLWLMIDGRKLDDSLATNCKGSRLHDLVGKYDDHSAHLFKKYHELYAQWRDDGIKKARDMLVEEERSVCIIALDLQEYYYRVQLDWKKLRILLKRPKKQGNLVDWLHQSDFLGGRLLECVEAIFESYQERIRGDLKITHDLPPEATCLPIGLCASPVIANWYLRDFDKEILSKVRPAYYGRYVDDILLVVANETIPDADPIKDFMDQVLVSCGVMKWHEKTEASDECYELVCRPGLFLQKKKCNLQYFDAHHSIAGLEKFKKQLEANASDFALLPVEGDESPVEQVAYDLLYDGSVNKLRSVKEIAENRWELAKHLAKQTQLYLIASGSIDKQTELELFRFFKGRNAVEYWDMWERVIAFFVVMGRPTSVKRCVEAIKQEVYKLRFRKSQEVAAKLRETLVQHLELSLELCQSIRKEGCYSIDFEGDRWRSSNLIRHHLIAVPLLNFTNFKGDFVAPSLADSVKIDSRLAKLSPRFVHFDECLGFIDSGFAELTEDDSVVEANELYEQFHSSRIDDVKFESSGPKPRKKK